MQLGQRKVTDFITVKNDLTPNSSSWTDFPTAENPNGQYKYVSVSFENDKHLRLITRSTYSFLDWLGDIGGLNDALVLIAQTLLAPASTFALQAKLLSTIFRFRESENLTKKQTIERTKSFNKRMFKSDDVTE